MARWISSGGIQTNLACCAVNLPEEPRVIANCWFLRPKSTAQNLNRNLTILAVFRKPATLTRLVLEPPRSRFPQLLAANPAVSMNARHKKAA